MIDDYDVDIHLSVRQGVKAFVLVFIVVTITILLDVEFFGHRDGFAHASGLTGVQAGSVSGATYLLGWFFFGAHFVPIDAVSPLGTISVDFFSNRVRYAALPAGVYHLLPMVVLTIVGYRTMIRYSDSPPIETAIVRGSAIALGYLPAATFSALIILRDANATGVVMRPGLFETVVVMGIIYPVIFGGLGAAWYRSRR